MCFVVAINEGFCIRRSSQFSDVGDGLSILSIFFGLFKFVLGGKSSASRVEGILSLHFSRDDIEVPIHIYKNNKMENVHKLINTYYYPYILSNQVNQIHGKRQ